MGRKPQRVRVAPKTDLQRAHEIFDCYACLTNELIDVAYHYDKGYITKQEALRLRWICDEALKAIQDKSVKNVADITYCNDCISREAVLVEMDERWKHESIITKEFIRSLPSVGWRTTYAGMTNGDMIKMTFPNYKIYEFTSDPSKVFIELDSKGVIETFNREWWNAPYESNKEVKE